MNRSLTSFQAILAGFGSAFALFPSNQLDQYAKRESTESRIYGNFARVGRRFDAAMSKVKDEQEESHNSAG